MCSFLHNVSAQNQVKSDSIQEKSPLTIKSQIVPLSIMALGGLAFIKDTKYYLRDNIGKTNTRIDDYIQYVPDFTVYGAHFLGMKHKNSLWNTAKYMAISQLATAVIVQSVKRITNLPRPYGGAYTFPSGHTSQSFVGATVQYHEFKDYNIAFAYLGYAFSTAVGVMRVTNDRHWVPDVVVGAGLGMLITNLVYYFEPFKEWNPFEKKKYAFTPSLNYQNNTACLGLNIVF